MIYCNISVEVPKTLKTILLADDTNLLCCGDNLEQLLDTEEKELSKMKVWVDQNKLTLNLNKTNS